MRHIVPFNRASSEGLSRRAPRAGEPQGLVRLRLGAEVDPADEDGPRGLRERDLAPLRGVPEKHSKSDDVENKGSARDIGMSRRRNPVVRRVAKDDAVVVVVAAPRLGALSFLRLAARPPLSRNSSVGSLDVS